VRKPLRAPASRAIVSISAVVWVLGSELKGESSSNADPSAGRAIRVTLCTTSIFAPTSREKLHYRKHSPGASVHALKCCVKPTCG
jgi:hypothetical protein